MLLAMMIHWLGHASFRIEGLPAEGQGSKTIYTDPWEVSGPKADMILITHEHYDHCSPTDVEKLSKPETKIIAPIDCASKLKGNVQSLLPGQSTTIDGIKIEAVPAYTPKKEFHPKANKWVGYIITIDGKRIYQAGDTDLIPEMKEVTCDIALLPVGGTYTMNAQEAAEASEWIQCSEFIPMHWGKIVGSEKDALDFKKLCKKKVTILKKE